jgi:hypothetical protein
MAIIYSALISKDCALKRCFITGEYKPSQTIVDDVKTLTYNSKKYVDDNFSAWLDKQVLTQIEDITNYRNLMSKYEQTLLKARLTDYAQCVAKKRDVELENSDKIKEKETLLNEIANFEKINIKLLGYQDLKSQMEVGNYLLDKLETFKDYLYQDYTEYYNQISEVNSTIKARLDDIKNGMNFIYDSVYNINSSSDFSKILSSIENILKYDLNPNDMEDFRELQGYLSSVQSDVLSFEKNNFKELNRENLTTDYQTLLQKYQDSEYNITTVITSTYTAILNTLDSKSSEWQSTYLTTFDYAKSSVEALMKWQKDTKVLPTYLTETVKELYHQTATHVEETLSEHNLDIAVQMFNDFNETEKQEFLKRILIKQ